jgi:hypothetical protein
MFKIIFIYTLPSKFQMGDWKIKHSKLTLENILEV